MILIRHGQSHFNAIYGKTRIDPGIADPGLTEEGRQQAQSAAAELARLNLRRIITSPYQRTLETTRIIAETLDLPISVEPLVRERAYFSCDIGTPRSELAARWPEHDFGHLEERWWTDPEESEDAMQVRCLRFHEAMAATPDWPQVLVVSHYAFIQGLTGETVQNGETVSYRPVEGARG